MAVKFGKWIGGTIGWAFGGPIGALVGFSLGYLYDNATLAPAAYDESGSNRTRSTYQGDFAISLMVLAAAMMKADQRVLKSELNYVKQFLAAQFGEEQGQEQLRILRDLLKRDYSLAPVCAQIKSHMSHAQRLQLLHFLVGIANADGEFHPAELDLLRKIARHLNVNQKDMESLEAMYQVDDDRYYRILEIEPGASNDEIKAAYRRMAKKYHPDKLGDVGDEVKNAAIEKFRQVQEAYDKLYKQG